MIASNEEPCRPSRLRRRTPRPAAAGSLPALALLCLATTAVAGSPESVFHVDRNKNRNQVHYGVHVDDRCRPEGTEPVYNYWLRLEKDPPVVEPLRLLQQAAYGFQKQRIETDGRIEIRLRALPDRQIVIRVLAVGGTCKAEPFITIDGRQAYLEKVFVFADEGFFVPTVRYIEPLRPQQRRPCRLRKSQRERLNRTPWDTRWNATCCER